jgi:hypothetical protein
MGADQKQIEKSKDQKADLLRRWCVRVRSFVLVPSHEEQAEKARPSPNGTLSPSMSSVIADADALTISDLPDVEAMVNCFKCMSWSL